MTDTTHEAPELLPCPFCGNDDIQDWGESTWSRPVKWMYCTECQAHGPRVMLERNEEETAWLQRAIAAWNTRSDDLVQAAVAAALREAAGLCAQVSNADLTVANPPYEAGYSDGADVCHHEILALITPDAQAALDRALLAEVRAVKDSFTAAYIELAAERERWQNMSMMDFANQITTRSIAAIREGGE